MKDAEEIILKKEDLDKHNSHLINQINIPELNKYIRKFTELVITRIQNNENFKKEFKEKFGKTFEEEFRDCKDDDEFKNKFKEKYKVKFKNIDIFKFFVKKIHQELQDENITNHFKPEDFIKFNAYFAMNINSIDTLDFEICTGMIRQYMKTKKLDILAEKKVTENIPMSPAGNKNYESTHILYYISNTTTDSAIVKNDKLNNLLTYNERQTINLKSNLSINDIYKIFNLLCNFDKYIQDSHTTYRNEVKKYVLLLAYIFYYKNKFLPTSVGGYKSERSLMNNVQTTITYEFFEIFLKYNKEKLSQNSEEPTEFLFYNISNFLRPILRDARITNKSFSLKNDADSTLMNNKFICLKGGYIFSKCPFLKTINLNPNKAVIEQVLNCPYIFKPTDTQLSQAIQSKDLSIHYWCKIFYKEENSCSDTRCEFFDSIQYSLFYYPEKINLSLSELIYFFAIATSKSQMSKLFKNNKRLTKQTYNAIFQSLEIFPEYFMEDCPKASNNLDISYFRLDKFTQIISRKQLNDFYKYFSAEFDDFEKQDADHSDKINKIDMKYINLAIEALRKNREINDIRIFAKIYNKIINKLNSIK